MTSGKNTSFTSTRNQQLRIGFWQSIVQGVAPDGGLLVPTELPNLPAGFMHDLDFWNTSKVNNISTFVHRLFIPSQEISDNDLAQMMTTAHNFDLPLEQLDDHTFILRIDTGPTASFKDLAARSLASLLEQYCLGHDAVINIVVATSGDTGVAIADAFGGSSKVTVSILYPDGGVSEIQEKQMIDVHDRYQNIQAIPIKGNFDVCQDIAKLLQGAREFVGADKKTVEAFIQEIENKLGIKISDGDVNQLVKIIGTLHLSSANSINIWRLIPQMTQYFVAYGKLVKENKIKAGDKIIFAVPSGNLGHLMAGLYAQTIGLPIKRFVISTNANNILANVIGSGTIKHHSFAKTSSPSMDILDPSNLERLLYSAAERDKKSKTIDFVKMKNDIKKACATDDTTSLDKYGVTKTMLSDLRQLIWAEDVETDDEVYSMMERIARRNKITMEPHGITALIATIRARAKHVIGSKDIVVVMETAHPDKFPNALNEADVKVAPEYKHKKLTQLAKTPISKMNKPDSMSVDLLSIAKQIKSISY